MKFLRAILFSLLLAPCAFGQVILQNAKLQNAVVTNAPTGGGGGGGCTTAYRAAPGIGTGDRRANILCTLNGNAAQWEVDGSVSDGKFFWGGAAAGTTNLIDLTTSYVVKEFRFIQSTTDTHGVWQVQGSPDGTTWTSIGGNFTLGGAITNLIDCSANTTSYRYYQWYGISGTKSANPWLRQTEIADCQ